MRRDDWLAQQLPMGMTDDDFLIRFLSIFQEVSDSVLEQIDAVGHNFDPSVAPLDVVRLMAAWLGIDWVDSELEEHRQRHAVRQYSQLLQWRGTAYGLRMLVELLTNCPAEVTDTGGFVPVDRSDSRAPTASTASPAALTAPKVTIRVADAGDCRIDDLIRIILAEVPASVELEFSVGGVQYWPASDDDTAATVRSGGRLESFGRPPRSDTALAATSGGST